MRIKDGNAPGKPKIRLIRAEPAKRPKLKREQQADRIGIGAGNQRKQIKTLVGHNPGVASGNWQSIDGMFRGRDVIIVGCGGSLYGFKFERLQELNASIIAVNNAIMEVPFADVMFSADKQTMGSAAWQDCLGKGVKNWKNPDFRLVCCWSGLESGGKITVCAQHHTRTPRPGSRIFAVHSGVGSITVALWGGAGRIFLLGMDSVRFNHQHLSDWIAAVTGSDWYDQKAVLEAKTHLQNPDARIVHYFSAERGHPADANKNKYTQFHRAFEKLKPDSGKIWNLSPISAIRAFQRGNIKMLDELLVSSEIAANE